MIPTLQGQVPRYARDRGEHASVYRELHEGRGPDRFVRQRVAKARAGRRLGRVTAIQYRKRTLESTVPHYHHPYGEGARPVLSVDRGNPVIWSGRSVVTTHGIEDLPASHQRGDRPPPLPRQLTDIGTLEWLEYESDDGQVHRLSFPFKGAPTIAHDERGNVHVVGGTVALKAQGEEVMRHRHGRRRHVRRNPIEASQQKTKSALMQALIVGTVAATTIVGLDYLFRQVSFLASLSSTVKNLLRIGIGVGGAVLLAKRAPSIASGIGVGGVFDGAIGFWQGMNGESFMELNSPGSPYAPGQPMANAPVLGAIS
jgi:hypothetical protein